MRDRLAKFMYGRNGNDQLNTFLLGLCLAVLILGTIIGSGVGRYTFILVLLLLALAYYRMLSRNVVRRREENGKYLRLRDKFLTALRVRKERWVQRKDYKFFTCPSCKTTLRVPKGHGKVNVVCCRCGKSFTGKT